MSEYQLHRTVIDYIRQQYPSIMWYSDLNGVRLHMGLRTKVKAIQHPKNKWLDLFFPEPRQGHSGLFIELKQEIYGSKGYKLKNGKIAGNEHIQAQAAMIDYFQDRGFAAFFAGGFDEAKAVIDWYFEQDLP